MFSLAFKVISLSAPVALATSNLIAAVVPGAAEAEAAAQASEEAKSFPIEPPSLPQAGEPSAQELQNLFSTETAPSAEARASVTVEIPTHQVELARKVAPAVVSLRAWDGAGNELARGAGCFIDGRGAILTDMQIVHPEFADRLEYITVSTAGGGAHRITGYWTRDLETGLTVLQSDATPPAFLPLQPGIDFAQERAVAVVALHQERDLSLADARIRGDQSRGGEGWLNVRGQDSPGEPGSPVIDGEGRVVAIISMRVPQGRWFNFATRIDALGEMLERERAEGERPLADLNRGGERSLAADPRFVRAFQALANGNARRATAQLLLLRKTYPRSAEVWALLGLSFATLGAREEALNCNRKAVALDPRVGQYWYQLALSHLEGSGDTPNPAALEALEQAVEQRPADAIAWLLLAEQRLLLKDWRGAEAALIDVAKLDPDSARASFLLGYAKGKQGEYEAAEAAMRRTAQLDGRRARPWFYLALLYTKQSRFGEAIAAYQEAVRLEPAHPSAWRNLALLQRKLGRNAEAGQAFERHRRLGASVR